MNFNQKQKNKTQTFRMNKRPIYFQIEAKSKKIFQLNFMFPPN